MSLLGLTPCQKVQNMPNFRLLISPVRFFGKEKEKQKTTTITANKQTNKKAKVILTVCLI